VLQSNQISSFDHHEGEKKVENSSFLYLSLDSKTEMDFVVNAFAYQVADGNPMNPTTSVPWAKALADSSAKICSIWSGNRTHNLRTSLLLFQVFAYCATGDDVED
jgi:hypothetical protein